MINLFLHGTLFLSDFFLFFYIQVCEDEEVNYIHISCIIQQLCFFVGETNEHLYCFMLKETAGQLVTSNRNRCLEESATTG